MGLWHKFVERHRAKKAEEEAIVRAAEEMHRIDEEPPKRDILSGIYAWLKGGGA
jgi:hypothetical protein